MPARHLDIRDDAYRGTYWRPPPKDVTPGLSPAQQSALRDSVYRAQRSCSAQDCGVQQWQASVTACRAHCAAEAARLQREMETPVGLSRSLATNVDHTTTKRQDINVNSLRSKKPEGPLPTLEPPGGNHYTTGVCIGNWVEERRDLGYILPDFHRVRRSQGATEYQSRCQSTAVAPSRRLRVAPPSPSPPGSAACTGPGAAPTIDPGFGPADAELDGDDAASVQFWEAGTCTIGGPTAGHHVATTWHPDATAGTACSRGTATIARAGGAQAATGGTMGRVDKVAYGRAGFGAGPGQDHTPPHLQGAPWVGTAPVRMWDSLAASAGRREALEFQARHPGNDPRAKILAPQPPLGAPGSETAEALRTRLARSQRFTRQWASTYARDFVPFMGPDAHEAAATSSGMRGGA